MNPVPRMPRRAARLAPVLLLFALAWPSTAGARITSYNVCYTKLLRARSRPLFSIFLARAQRRFFSDLRASGSAGSQPMSSPVLLADFTAALSYNFV